MRSRKTLIVLGVLSVVGGAVLAAPKETTPKPEPAGSAKPQAAAGRPSTKPALRRMVPMPKEMDVATVAVPPSPSLSPEGALGTIKVPPGYRVELVAAEPLVQDPISISFDGDGRLWVCEMRSYMPDVDATNETAPTGRISVLTDTDGDGRMDRQTIFADGLVLPRVASPYRDGAFVAAPPNLWFMRDTNGDGKADERQLLAGDYTNNSNPEHQPNGMLPALDNWVYNSQWAGAFRYVGDGYPAGLRAPAVKPTTHPAGDAKAGGAKAGDAPDALEAGTATPAGVVTKANALDGAAASIPGKRVPPDRRWVRVDLPSRGQWGISQDDVGRLFVNTNSDNLRGDQLPIRMMARNPNFPTQAGVNVTMAAKGDADFQKTWPIRPTPGINRGYQAQMLTDDGYLTMVTAVCAPLVYRGNLMKDLQGDAFVAEPSGNLVKRNRIAEKDGLVVATNTPYELPDGRKADFLASTDERFRPVFLADGPDGALYVADLYRGVLQHKKYVTPYLRKQVLERKLENPLHLGRIYRVVPENYRRPTTATRPNMSKAPAAELVQHLSHPNGWWRDRAQQALVARNDVAVVPALKQAASGGKSALGRLHALYTLDGLRQLDPVMLAWSLKDDDPRVRVAAARLADAVLRDAPKAAGGPLAAALVNQARDDDPAVRLAVLMTAAAAPQTATAKPVLDALAADVGRSYVGDAFLSGAAGGELEVLQAVLAHPAFAIEPAAAANVAAPNVATADDDAGDVAASSKVDGGGAKKRKKSDGTASRPAEPRVVLLGQLAGAVVRDGKPDRVQTLLAAVAADAGPNTRWRAVAMLNGVAPADAKSKPKVVALPAEPKVLKTLSAAGNADLTKAVASAAKVLTWPGKQDVQAVAAARPMTSGEKESFERGKVLFATTCAACHEADGNGSPGKAPSMRNSPLLVGHEGRPIRIVLHGLRGRVVINGEAADMEMPTLAALNDEQVADALTYTRREWDHRADPVTKEAVAKVREEMKERGQPWDREEITALRFPGEKNPPKGEGKPPVKSAAAGDGTSSSRSPTSVTSP